MKRWSQTFQIYLTFFNFSFTYLKIIILKILFLHFSLFGKKLKSFLLIFERLYFTTTLLVSTFYKMISNTQFTGCAFCRANDHKLKNKQGQILCIALLNNECQRCHIKGHTTKHCTITFQPDQRVKTEQQPEQQPAIKANSWAAKIKANLKAEVLAKIAEDDRKVASENAAKLDKKAEEKRIAALERKAEYERNYEPNMQRKYGIKQDFVVPPIGYWEDELVLPAGSFWEFMVEGSRDDSEFAKSRRKDPENSSKLHAYLAEKYGRNWLQVSQGKEDDCPYLSDLREKERRRQDEEEWEQEQRQREQWKQIQFEIEQKEREREEMERKLLSREITRKEQ